MAYNVYSLPDTRTVLYHPDVGTANLHQCGHGKITVSAAGDLTSHTMTADGYYDSTEGKEELADQSQPEEKLSA
jgi:hypothetical protein